MRIPIPAILAVALSLNVSFPLLARAAGESPVSASQPGTVTEAKMLIERTKQEIAQEEKTWTEETTREKEAESRRRKRFSDFGEDRVRLQQSLAEQEEKLKATLAKMETHQYRERELQARFQKLGQVLSSRAKELRAALAQGMPYRMDKRLETLDLLVRDIDGGNISPEEAMNRLWAVEQNERRLAQESEVYSGDFDAGAADPIQVKFLRVGKQLLAFSSMDGSKLGILRKDSAGYAWVRETELDRDARQALKVAIATAEGKALPGFVPLPVWRSAFAQAAVMTPPADGASESAAPAAAKKRAAP
ncbi:MAG: DUF3450 family protein [Fibrobacteria bacterium]